MKCIHECVCVTVPRCVCVCDIVLIAVCGTLIVLITLPCDKNKYVIISSLLFYDVTILYLLLWLK